ncbi:MAG: DUF2892 domain-containing protein [Rhodospirillales bacterium]|nr:DUF2892 domain-containing protein [Rhodospirillales bacterium]USO07277.1 MAG: DUF2892 domain-containing protein [Rhodospirillales bacterium]
MGANKTNIDKAVLRFAGVMTLASALLAYMFGPGWLLLTAFVGLNLFQASFTGFCPLVKILKKLGLAPGAAFE